MEMTFPFARPFARRPVAPTSVAAAGAAALALGFYMAIGARQPIVAALAGRWGSRFSAGRGLSARIPRR